jgi:formate-dependent nitrite reductase membrane component NrfD
LTDGRNIDPQLGTLSGEGSAQFTLDDRPHDKSLSRHVFEGAPVQSAAHDPTYYGWPIVKKSPWSWSIPLYYYVGGTAGGSAVLGASATLLGRGRFPLLTVRSRWIGALGGAVSGALLIYDLGRPSRFLNMLRVFRPTSPMNMGTWILTGFSAAAGFAAVASCGPARLHVLSDIAAVKAGVFGLVLSGYTGVLVSQTAVPVWQRPHRTMPLLFLASAAASASSLMSFFEWNESERRAIAVFGFAGRLADLGCGQIAEQQIGSVPEAARPLREGLSGLLWNAGKAFTAASLALSLAPGSSRRKDRWIGALGTAGALCLRFGIHYAGQRSAENPRATFHQQRAEFHQQRAALGGGAVPAQSVPHYR